jgi:isopentenyl-diphosphate delta-isomerase
MTTSSRKKEHLRIALSKQAQIGDNGFSKYRFINNSLPEVDFDKIDTSTTFFSKKVDYPFFISCMTGGLKEGKKINRNLASAAAKYNIAMGVGSQRAAIEDKKLRDTFVARRYAAKIPVIANVGLVQFNYGFGKKEFQECIDMVKADALALHVNPMQEAIQPEGDRNFSKLLPKLKKILPKLSKPVIVKEVGFGLSAEVCERFYKIGVRYFDTAGWGGTNWSWVEGQRGNSQAGMLFAQEWGIPSAEAIKQCAEFAKTKKDVVILGSGGIRNGLEIAKALALGAEMVGIAAPFAKAALVSQKEMEKLIESYAYELRVAMFGVGAKNINQLRQISIEI